MNSLKLIEEEIKHLKDILESDYILDVPYLRDTEYQVWANDRLQTLQQIKLELEVLEIIKNRVPKRLILEFVSLEEEDIVAKALEVENEQWF